MNPSTEAARRERIEAVLALAAARLAADQRTPFAAFARACFQHLEAEDLAARSPEDLLGALLSGWQFGAERAPGTTRLRVISPSLAEHGWASRHTVIEAVNDDMPFLVDTITMELNRQGLSLQLIVHPVLVVQRDATGRLQSLRELGVDEHDTPGLRESWMHIEVDRLVDAAQRAELAAGLERVLEDVRAAVRDWQPMLQRLHEAIAELQPPPPTVPAAQAQECRAFLQWLADDHLTLLGYRRHDLAHEQGEDQLRLVPGSGLGVLRESGQAVSASFAAVPAQARAMARAPTPVLLVTRSNTRSTVHRPGYTDYVGVKRYNAAGEVIGEHRFVGLFTSTAYSARVEEIPLLRQKVAAVAQRAALPEGGHLAKALDHILATYPRDDLFQIGEDELLDAALGILAAGERQRLRLFLWRDPYERFVSCLVYVPREAYSTELRKKFQAILMAAFAGQRADFGVMLGDTLLARVHFSIRTTPGQVPPYDRHEIEAALAAAARRWDDELRDALVDEVGEGRGMALFKRWAAAFPQVYREIHRARAAVPDLLQGRRLDARAAAGRWRCTGRWAAARTAWASRSTGWAGRWCCRTACRCSSAWACVCSARTTSASIARAADGEGEQRARCTTSSCEAQVADELEPELLARLFEDTFAQVFRGEVENDDFNRLVLRAGLAAEDIVVLRAYAKYCKQIGFALTQATIEATLAAQPHIARMLVKLFRLRLHPTEHDDDAAASQVHAIEQALDRVSNLNEDRVLRQLLALVLATLRCNHWRTGVGHSGAAGPRRSFLSLKLDSAQVPGLPSPRPLCRDLRLLAALRRHPPARRQGGARRPALERPAGRLPHRGAGPGEGADGEEHRHRAGGQQGRLRAEEAAAGQRARGLSEGRRGLLPGLPARPARPDRQPGGRPGGAAAAGAPDGRRRPLPGGGGRQGHGHLLRPCQRHLGRIRPLAGRRLRLGRQRRLRPQGHGHHRARRVGKCQAPLPRAGRGHAEPATSRWSASATCRATCSATACCCRGTSGCWRPSTTAMSSSTPTRTRPPPLPSASGCSSCRARPGPTTTRS